MLRLVISQLLQFLSKVGLPELSMGLQYDLIGNKQNTACTFPILEITLLIWPGCTSFFDSCIMFLIQIELVANEIYVSFPAQIVQPKCGLYKKNCGLY